MSLETLRQNLRTVPDFPKKGILFYDITTLLKNPACFAELVERLCEPYLDKGVTKVVGVESRGYIMASVIAARLGAGFVPVRKAGKLPAEVYADSCNMEYGSSQLEIHRDAIAPDDTVLIHDDLLATGGTVSAAWRLVERNSPKQVYFNFIIELSELEGRKALPAGVETTSVLQL